MAVTVRRFKSCGAESGAERGGTGAKFTNVG